MSANEIRLEAKIAGFYCETPGSGEPPCAGVLVLRECIADLERQLAEVMGERDGCICSGNWRRIIAEAEPLFGRRFDRIDGVKNHKLIGVMHSNDDYYYVMSTGGGRVELLSCVGDLDIHGYKVAE